jgi:O-antigen/teichoic acid export membrane protein
MGIVFRQSLKTSVVTFGGALLGAAILYMSVRILTTQQYGFSRNLIAQSLAAVQLILMGIHSMLNVYVHKYPPGDVRRKVLLTWCLTIPVLLSVLLSIPYYIFRSQIVHFYKPEDQWLAARYFDLLPFSAFLWSAMTLLEQYLCSQMKVAASAFMREIAHRLVQIAILGLFAAGYISFDVFLSSTIFSAAAPVALLFWMAARTEGFGISFELGRFSRKEYIELLRFSFYHMLTNVSMFLLTYVDALMLAPLAQSGTSAVAVYSPAVFLMSILSIPYRALATAAMPDLAAAYEQNQMGKVENVFNRAAINGWIIGVGMMAIIVCNLPNAVRILRPEYAALQQVAIILVIGRMADMLTGLNNEILSISKHYRLLFWMTVGLVVMIIAFNWWLIPIYGVVGAAAGTTLAMTLFNILKLIVVKAKLGLQPISKQTGYVLLAGIVAMLPGYFMPFLGYAVWDAIVRSTVIAAAFGVLMLLLKPSKDMHHLVEQVRSKKRLF